MTKLRKIRLIFAESYVPAIYPQLRIDMLQLGNLELLISGVRLAGVLSFQIQYIEITVLWQRIGILNHAERRRSFEDIVNSRLSQERVDRK